MVIFMSGLDRNTQFRFFVNGRPGFNQWGGRFTPE